MSMGGNSKGAGEEGTGVSVQFNFHFFPSASLPSTNVVNRLCQWCSSALPPLFNLHDHAQMLLFSVSTHDKLGGTILLGILMLKIWDSLEDWWIYTHGILLKADRKGFDSLVNYAQMLEHVEGKERKIVRRLTFTAPRW